MGVARARLHEVRDRLGLDAVEDPRAHQEVVVRDQILGPVHPKVVALVPETIRGVLLDDIQLFTRHGVVRTPDIEVALDAVHRDGRASLRITGNPIRLRVRDVLVGPPRDQEVLLDLPLDLLETALFSHEGVGSAVGRIDDGLLEVPFAFEDVFVEDVGLNLIDRRLPLCATRCHDQGREQGQSLSEGSGYRMGKVIHRGSLSRGTSRRWK